MKSNDSIIDYENVNGVKLILKINKRCNVPNSTHFTVSYNNDEKKSSWPKVSWFLAIVINIIALIYIRLSITTVLIIVFGLLFLVFFWITHSVQSESLLVIPTVGIQSSVKYVCGREDNFVTWASIDDVIINEVIKMNRVLYYLTVLVKENDGSVQEYKAVKLIPLFKYTKPRLMMLEKIYAELQDLLADTQRETVMGAGDKR